ncbi:endo-1,4-beta-xylanase B-like [Panicum miliaceum]|uniref:Endo-1,4-beta-xylanase B-like n=1 Tax=Panicum miliaceum TaxID=4540 RepID=A0A3L6RT42_PANMI|nr:endo-1,4-beta-xylanase B-like [Panicum miliaceum]
MQCVKEPEKPLYGGGIISDADAKAAKSAGRRQEAPSGEEQEHRSGELAGFRSQGRTKERPSLRPLRGGTKFYTHFYHGGVATRSCIWLMGLTNSTGEIMAEKVKITVEADGKPVPDVELSVEWVAMGFPLGTPCQGDPGQARV